MEMTYDQYIQNPMGIKNSVISNREMYRQMYTKKWDALKVRENGQINYLLMKSKTDYYVYIKIPSEVVPKLYYDVVIRFYPAKNRSGILIDRTVNEYNVQFFSNDPSFVYTFAHAFAKNNMIITDLNSRMSKLALKHRAEQRNPQDQVGYVKSLYFAYLEIKSKGLMQKIKYGTAEKYDKNKLLSMIMPADAKIEQRQKEEERIRKKEKRTSNDQKKTNSKSSSPNKESSKNPLIRPIERISGKSKISSKSKISASKKSKFGH